MKIEDKMIAEKKIVGKTADGDPVVMVVTHGGLYAFFSKSGNTISTLGMAPHKAIALWMAERKAGSIKWKDDFIKNENNELKELRKNNDTMFVRLRKLMFSPNALVKTTEVSDYFIVYDTINLDIAVLHRDEVADGILVKSIKPSFLIRNVNLTESVGLVSDHKEFK